MEKTGYNLEEFQSQTRNADFSNLDRENLNSILSKTFPDKVNGESVNRSILASENFIIDEQIQQIKVEDLDSDNLNKLIKYRAEDLKYEQVEKIDLSSLEPDNLNKLVSEFFIFFQDEKNFEGIDLSKLNGENLLSSIGEIEVDNLTEAQVKQIKSINLSDSKMFKANELNDIIKDEEVPGLYGLFDNEQFENINLGNLNKDNLNKIIGDDKKYHLLNNKCFENINLGNLNKDNLNKIIGDDKKYYLLNKEYFKDINLGNLNEGNLNKIIRDCKIDDPCLISEQFESMNLDDLSEDNLKKVLDKIKFDGKSPLNSSSLRNSLAGTYEKLKEAINYSYTGEKKFLFIRGHDKTKNIGKLKGDLETIIRECPSSTAKKILQHVYNKIKDIDDNARLCDTLMKDENGSRMLDKSGKSIKVKNFIRRGLELAAKSIEQLDRNIGEALGDKGNNKEQNNNNKVKLDRRKFEKLNDIQDKTGLSAFNMSLTENDGRDSRTKAR